MRVDGHIVSGPEGDSLVEWVVLDRPGHARLRAAREARDLGNQQDPLPRLASAVRTLQSNLRRTPFRWTMPFGTASVNSGRRA